MVEWRACWTLNLEVCGSNHEERKGGLFSHYPQVAPLAFLPGSFYRKIGICFGRCKIPEIVKFGRNKKSIVLKHSLLFTDRARSGSQILIVAQTCWTLMRDALSIERKDRKCEIHIRPFYSRSLFQFTLYTYFFPFWNAWSHLDLDLHFCV